jgi:cytoskeletal protein CcmA (bactofilin family)
MFRKRSEATPSPDASMPAPAERITSVLSTGISWKGQLGGSGGVRIEGTFDGEIALRGILVVGETGRVTCQVLRANTVIVAGVVKGDIVAERLEIRSTGRVWGSVVAAAFSTEEGAFLRGQITMEEKVDIGVAPLVEPSSTSPAEGDGEGPLLADK